MKKSILLLIPIFLTLSACVSSGKIIKVGKDRYSITNTGEGLLATDIRTRDTALQRGIEFCEKLGKHFELENDQIHNSKIWTDTTVTILFRCID